MPNGDIRVRFDEEDVLAVLPTEGWHRGRISGVWNSPTGTGRDSIKVKIEIQDTGAPVAAYVWDQFVLGGRQPGDDSDDGEGLAVARRRLADLIRATGLKIVPGEEVQLAALVRRLVMVNVGHRLFRGQPRAQVRSYQLLPQAQPNAAFSQSKIQNDASTVSRSESTTIGKSVTKTDIK